MQFLPDGEIADMGGDIQGESLGEKDIGKLLVDLKDVPLMARSATGFVDRPYL
jgi:hypothetical protein